MALSRRKIQGRINRFYAIGTCSMSDTESAAKDIAGIRLHRWTTAVEIAESCVILARFRQEIRRRDLVREPHRKRPQLAFPPQRRCESLWLASELFTRFPKHEGGWLGHGCARSNLVISSTDFGEPGGLDLSEVLLIKTLDKEFCEFSSTFDRQRHGSCGEFLQLAHNASSAHLPQVYAYVSVSRPGYKSGRALERLAPTTLPAALQTVMRIVCPVFAIVLRFFPTGRWRLTPGIRRGKEPE